jgi:hypothetical protein
MSADATALERAHALLDRIDSLVAARDRAGAIGAAHQTVRGGAVTIPQLYVLVLAPLMRLTGERWQTGAEDCSMPVEASDSTIVRTIPVV